MQNLMEGTKTAPVYISNVTTGDLMVEEKSVEDEWQDLEYFWGVEKQRLQDLDGQLKPTLSSSLEEHFLHDCLQEPKDSDFNVNSTNTTVYGKDVKDIPTSYIIDGFKEREHIVIGTYVDKEIIPGFQYRVRKNLSEEFLFDGTAKHLESVGLGYGKRLTFEGNTLNENENYFWSDSRVHGYALIFQTLKKDQVLNIHDTRTENIIGKVVINNPSTENDHVFSSVVGERGYVEKKVEVSFTCDVTIIDSSNFQNILIENVAARAEAVMVKESFSAKAKISHMSVTDFLIKDCLLLPEE